MTLLQIYRQFLLDILWTFYNPSIPDWRQDVYRQQEVQSGFPSPPFIYQPPGVTIIKLKSFVTVIVRQTKLERFQSAYFSQV
jgi:hypothetical protein